MKRELPDTNPIIGVSFGIIYGLLLRLTFETKYNFGQFEIVSRTFLIAAPFVVGAIAVYYASKNRQLLFIEMVSISFYTILFFMFAMYVLFLEGLICIFLVFPIFVICSIFGGLLMGFILMLTDRVKGKGTLNCLLMLPFLLSPLESHLPIPTNEKTVSTSIIINAEPNKIFGQLTAVKNIDESELGFSFMRLIGLPRPLEAAMNGSGVGSVRTSKWDKNVSFKERITVWNSPYQLHYQFDIPPGTIPREALDRHVEIGGQYFKVLRGGYDIKVIGKKQSELILWTTYANTSHLQLYGNVWAKYVLNDFHDSLLHLMKQRAEYQSS